MIHRRLADGAMVLALLVGFGCETSPPVHHDRIVVQDSREASAPQRGGVTPTSAPAAAREVFPGVRLDLAAGTVEFAGVVPIDAHDAHAPQVYLELIVCTPDTREHESLVVTRARASHVHAALLMLGLEPGGPGEVRVEAESVRLIPPRGAPVDVMFRWKDAGGAERSAMPQEWIVSARSKVRPEMPEGSFVFAGSQMLRRGAAGEGAVYDADGAGTLIGLTTFASETIAWRRVVSPDSSITEPEWIADASAVPPIGTPVTVVLRGLGGGRKRP